MKSLDYAAAFVRITLGWMLLWAFFDKLFGLGFATAPERAWITGGSPTMGFLSHADGPFASLFQAMAGVMAIDVLFMTGLACIGLALLLGIGLRIAGYAGATMMALMFLAASLPPDHKPLIDEHIVYAGLFLWLTVSGPGAFDPLAKRWASCRFVKRHPILR